jgi:hypothetical protein
MERQVFFLLIRSLSHHFFTHMFTCMADMVALLHGICAAQILIILSEPITIIPELRKVASHV